VTSLQVPRPHALEGVLALADGSSQAGGSFLAPEVDGWLASPEQGLTAAIESVRGADATAGALARLAPSTLTVVATTSYHGACWAEITRRGETEPETCLAGLTYDATGVVTRLVLLRVPLVPILEVGTGPDAPDAQPILQKYFADLSGSRFREAAAHFTVDTLYSHPPYAGGTERVLFRSREALWRGFVTERGESPVRQVVTGFWQQQDRVFVEGVIEGIPNGGTFFATAQVSSDGEIARYVAFYGAKRITSAND
jgi:hypothetical protein